MAVRITGRWRGCGSVVAAVALTAGCSSPGTLREDEGRQPATTTPATTVDADADAGLVSEPSFASSPVVDADRLGGLAFTDVTAAAGLDVAHAAGPIEGQGSMAGGAAVADYDGDGDLDVYLTRVGLANVLARNDGDGTFTDVAAAAGVEGPHEDQGYAAAVWGDVDGDGDLDLFVTSGERADDVLFANDGDGTFTDETAARGLARPLGDTELGSLTFGAAFSDTDLDGDLDLVVTQWDPWVLTAEGAVPADEQGATPCAFTTAYRAAGMPRSPGADPNRSRFFRNDGDGTFTDTTAEVGLPLDQVVAFTPVFSDLDRDGWPDLLLTGDGCTSRVFHNEGGRTFRDVTDELGVGTDDNGMGSVVEDIDGDGLLDWFVTGIAYPTEDGTCPARGHFAGCSGNRLYLGQDDGGFRDATDELGVREGWWGWGAAAADLDNDGDLDLAQTAGFAASDATQPDDGTLQPDERRYYEEFLDDPMRLWLNEGSEPFAEVSAAVGLDDEQMGKALVALDHDGDGDLDLLVVNTEGTPVLYRNDLPSSRWLDVRLVDPTAQDARGIGARVVVDPGGGAPVRTTEVRASGSFQSAGPTDVHVGLGDHEGSVASVSVWWPGEAEPQVITDVAIGRVVTVTRP